MTGDLRTLGELLVARAATDPAREAFTFVDDGDGTAVRRTYSELAERCNAVASMLLEKVPRGSRVLLLYPPGLEYVEAFLACQLAGIVAVPAYPPDPMRLQRTLPRLTALAEDSGAAAVLTNPMIAAIAEGVKALAPSLGGLAWIATGAEAAGRSVEVPVDSGAVAFLQYTSGSTGMPKGVVLTHDNLLANLRIIVDEFRLGPDERGVIWLPPYHDMGLIGGILAPILGRTPTVLMSPLSFLQRPARWLEAISRHRGTVSGGPNFAFDLVARKMADAEVEALDLSSWRLAFCGAEQVRSATVERFVRRFSRAGFQRDAFYPCYGLAEATLIVSGSSGRQTVERLDPLALERNLAVPTQGDPATEITSVGPPVADFEVAIVDPSTATEVAEGQVGELWVRGASVARGYWQRVDATAATFGATTTGGRGPFLRTGDLGYVRAGNLFIAGRLKDLIIIRGRNHYPHDIEQTAESSHPAIRRGCCAAFAAIDERRGEQLAIVLEIERRQRERRSAPAATGGADRRGSDRRVPELDRGFAEDSTSVDLGEIASQVRRAVAEAHGLVVDRLVIVRAGAVPKTSSGKLQRQECRASLLSGALAVDALFESDGARPVSTVPPPPSVSYEEDSPLSALRVLSVRSNERLAWVIDYLRNRVGLLLRTRAEDIDIDVPLSRLGVDSITAVELSHLVEQTSGVLIHIADLLQGISLREIAGRIIKLAEAARPESTAVQSLASSATLSKGQEGLWFLQRMAPDDSSMNLGIAVRITPAPSVERLRDALDRVMAKHAMLRTRIVEDAGIPRRELANVSAEPHVVDSRAMTDEQVRDQASAFVAIPFRMDVAPIARIALLERESEAVLVVATHHCVADFWSLIIVLNDFRSVLRDGTVPVMGQRLEYDEYVRRQLEYLGSPAAAEDLEHWRGELMVGGMLPPDIDWPPAPDDALVSASLRWTIDADVSSAIRRVASEGSTTPFVVLLTAVAVTLTSLLEREEVVVGVPVAGRHHAGFADTFGYFVNVIPLRLVVPEADGNLIIADVRDKVLAGLRHGEMPLPALIERLNPERRTSNPLANVLFAFERAQESGGGDLAPLAAGDDTVEKEFGDLKVRAFPLATAPAPCDLEIAVSDLRDTFDVSIRSDGRRVPASLAATIASSLRRSLAELVGVSSRPPLAASDAQPQVRAQVVSTGAGRGGAVTPSTLVDWLQARDDAGQLGLTSIRDASGEIDGASLWRRAGLIASGLQRVGVLPGDVVGIWIDRSCDMLATLLGVMRAGAAYLPLDPKYPAERLQFMTDDLGVRHVVSTRGVAAAEAPPLSSGASWSSVSELIARGEAGAVGAHPAPSDVAYVLFTSGSTGRPKGVAVTHGGLVNVLRSVADRVQIGPEDLVMASTSPAFDIAVTELYLPLLVGAWSYIASDDEVVDAEALLGRAAAVGATVMQATPSFWGAMLNGRWARLRIALSAGEPMTPALITALAATGATIWNLYGPTETAVYSTCRSIADPTLATNIGNAVDETTLHVLDRRLRPVAPGLPGQLFIGGTGLAHGYLHRPGLTAERFVPCPFGPPGSRMYATGDRVRLRQDGTLEFLGRIDHQVKLRGQRIEPGEVEAAVRALTGIDDVVVMARELGPGDKRLIAYVATQGRDLDTDGVRTRLAQTLPAVMVPSFVIALDEFPKTPNLKVDRAKLPLPASRGVGAAEADDPLTRVVAHVFSDVLMVPCGGDTDFFAAGGHSLVAARVAAQLGELLGQEVPIAVVLRGRTPRGVAEGLSTDPRFAGVVDAAPDVLAVLELTEDEAAQQLGALGS